MKDSEEPSKRMPFTGNAKREVRIEQIRLRHIADHIRLLFEPHLKQLSASFERYSERGVELFRMHAWSYLQACRRLLAVHTSKFRGVHIQAAEQLKPNFAAVVVLFLVISVFTHYAIATAAGTTPLSNFLLGGGSENSEEVVVVEEEEVSEPEYVNEPITTGRTVNATAYTVTNVPPRQKETVAVRKVWVPMTAYSSTPDQTDSTPFTTASGTRVRDGVVAANFLPIGTKIRIPDYYGDKVFVVEDRMNARYWQKVDIWMPTRAQAMAFGLRRGYIEIIEER